MRANKSQAISSMTTRQKVTAGIFLVVIVIVLWQVIGMFKGSHSTTPTLTPTASNKAGMAMKQNMPPPMPTPQATEVTKLQPAPTPREMELMRLQQETQANYLSALNELQMLKISREIAETNQAIAAAKLATVTAEKNIVNLLAPQPQVPTGGYGRGLLTPTTTGTPIPPPSATLPTQEIAGYAAISVSQLQYKWGAVLGYQGNLYNVSVGDVMPPDGSVVMHIDKSGIVLEKHGIKKKVSLVPII